MNEENYKMIISYHLSDNFYKEIKECYDEQINGDSTKYLAYDIRYMNNHKGEMFYILGLLDDKVITSCTIQQYYNDNSYFLITDFQTRKEFQHQGYGIRLIDYAVTILKEKNAARVCMFCESLESEKVALRLRFIKNEKIKEFGYISPGNEKSLYYELKLNTNFLLTEVTSNDAYVVGKIMMSHLKEYESSKVIPKVLLPNVTMWRDNILASEKLDNEKNYIIKCGKITIGYTGMFYEDYDDIMESDHNTYFWLWLDKDYLYDQIVNIVINKVSEYHDEIKKSHNVKEIIFKETNIIPSQYEFIKKNLEKNGFTYADNLFIKK